MRRPCPRNVAHGSVPRWYRADLLQGAHHRGPHLLAAFVAVAPSVSQQLIDVNTDLQAIADFAPGNAHDFLCVLDLLFVLHLQQYAVVNQHVRNDAGLTQAPRREPQHFGAVSLHWEIIKRALVRPAAQVKRPTKDRLHLPIEHGALHLPLTPFPEVVDAFADAFR